MTLSSAQADAYKLLRTDLYAHLDEADFLALKFDDWSEQDAANARKLIPELVTVIRAIVALHEPPEAGPNVACRTCGSIWPCPAIETIHGLVKDPEREFVRLVRRADWRD